MVSVIITTKNEEKNIGRLLTSLRAQTYKNLEIVVVDNYSIDATAKIAKKFTEKVFLQGPERSVQRNFGAAKAKGEYLFFLDADMELTRDVVKSCVENINGHAALIVPEKTVGESLIAKVRTFEREMYMGDPTIEVARFFKKKIFNEFDGYDPELTGPEDYDLPYQMSKEYTIGWAKKYILHHEEDLTLGQLLRKKFYYGKKGAKYAAKHPELVKTQGNLLFRRAYFRSWRKFIQKPVLGLAFIFVRILETVVAITGYLTVVTKSKL